MVAPEYWIDQLLSYGLRTGILAKEDYTFTLNALLDLFRLDSFETPENAGQEHSLEDILDGLMAYAGSTGLLEAESQTKRDLFDTKIMGLLTPAPSTVISRFADYYARSPIEATDYFYKLCRDIDYIRTARVAKDVKWTAETPFGLMDITINLSKPEKDPADIAAQKLAPQSGYPKCLLCMANEGYAGRANHPARQNLRIIPLKLEGQNWGLQYSPYVYYNEHCIVMSDKHVPMKIDDGTFHRLLDFVAQFPHYFIGSNADLPIVGGSILSHDHFQGGCYTFAMARAEVYHTFTVPGFQGVTCGLVKWPMSVIRIKCPDKEHITSLASHILQLWRGYTDESASVFAHTNGEPHNTITPIARFRDGMFELDLVLRNNRTTQEHPMGLFHPHENLHHIKKENIGLIEVMGLAVLPPRLLAEMEELKRVILAGEDLGGNPQIRHHAAWAQKLMQKHSFTQENIDGILRQEIGLVFAAVLDDAGVFKYTTEGKNAFLRFLETVCNALPDAAKVINKGF